MDTVNKCRKMKWHHQIGIDTEYRLRGKSWKLYLASSAKGSKNIVYAAKQSTRDKSDCAVTNDYLPKRFREELDSRKSDWSVNGDNHRHKNSASCGEQNALLMIFAEQGDMPKITKETSSIVAIAGRIKGQEYQGGITIPPCTEDGGYGCDEVLKKYFGENIDVINKDQAAEPYEDNKPVEVGVQPLFDVKQKSSDEDKDEDYDEDEEEYMYHNQR